MPRYSRLSPLGVSGRFIGVIAAATGTMACGGTFTGVSADTSASGTIAGTSTWSGVASSTAATTGSILGRWLDTGGVGASVVAATGSFSGPVSFVGSSAGQLGRLTALGVTGRFYSPAPKASSLPRLWNVSETFGLNVSISDFTERRFFLVDTFGLNLDPTASFTGAVGALPSTSTWSGVSLATASVTGSLPVTTTWSGVGQNVIVHSADGSLPVTVTFAGQGSEAGGVAGVGVGLLEVAGTFTGVGRSNAAATASFGTLATFDGIGASVFTATGSLSATSNWSGDSTVNVPGVGALDVVSTWTGAGLSIAASSPNLSIVSVWSGVPILPEPAAARRNRHTVIRSEDRSTNVIRKSRRTAI